MEHKPIQAMVNSPAVEKPLWEENWHLLCHRSELGAPNDFVRFEMFGEEVVAFNDGLEAVVFDNRCPHRGTRIFDGHSGNRRWVCPYHGWAFAKGKLFVSMKSSFEDCDIEQAELPRYRAEWVGDFLFVSKRPAQFLADQIAGVADIVAGISHSIGSRRDFNAYDYQCNWKISVENALDQYHVALVHKDSLNRLRMNDAVDEYFGRNNISYASLGDERLERKLKSLRRFFDLAYQSEGYIAVHLFPFTFLTSTYGYSYSLQQFYPSADPDVAHFNSRFYASKTSSRIDPKTMDTFFQSAVEVNHQVFAEDAAICGRVPTDTWSPELPRFLSRGEAKLVQFRTSMAEFLGQSGARR
jgi:phenylpropionate dioxygenase-like ring-hydroxylating dioxygenase large terminal subunit